MTDLDRQLLLDNPDLFLVTYFPNRVDELKDFHLRLIDTATTQERGLILYPAQHGKCLAPQTSVLMASGDLVEARNVHPGDLLSEGRCIASEPNGVRPVVRVRLSTGHEIVTTRNHPFYLGAGEWMEAENLGARDPSDSWSTPDKPWLIRHWEAPGSYLSDEAFRLLGYMIGDGCVTKGNCSFTTADPEVLEDFSRCASSLEFVVRPKGGHDYALNSRAVRPWLEMHGLRYKTAWEKRIPREVLRGNSRQIRHFLAAYYACDGSLGSSAEFYSVSEGLLRDVQHLLLRLGVVTKLAVKNGLYGGQRHRSWRLTVPSSGWDEMRTWPIPLERKLPPVPTNRRLYEVEVVAVEDAGEQETWALQVEGGTHYTADILTHNTTLVSTLLPIWALCKNPNVRIAIIAKNESEATGIMQVLQAELVANDELIRDFGPFRDKDDPSKPWALERMSVARRTLRAKEPTVAVFGSGAKTALGHRTNWTICDDVVTGENSATPITRGKTKDWFNLAVSTMGLPNRSRLTVVGTVFDPQDLYHDLIEMADPETGQPLWHVQKEDAIVDEETCTVLWPEWMPWRMLQRKKWEIGTLDFNKRYRNIAVDKTTLVFKEEYVKGGWVGKDQYPGCLDAQYTIGDYDEEWPRVAGFDAAAGRSKQSKFCAHVVLAAGSCDLHTRCYWVVDLERDQMIVPKQRDMILQKHLQYGLTVSRIEDNAYQEGLEQIVREKADEQGLAIRVQGHTTGSNKIDPDIGVTSMGPWFEQGKIHIPQKTIHDRRRMQVLIDELVTYPGRTTDCVMALWFAWLALETGTARYQSYNRLAQKKSVWAPRLGGRVLQNPIYT